MNTILKVHLFSFFNHFSKRKKKNSKNEENTLKYTVKLI